jgi:D-3-phosphoglycerate dehydrogenase
MTRDESRRVHIAQRIDSAAVHELAEHYEVSVGYGDHNVELSEAIDRVGVLVVQNMTLDNALVDRACRLRLIVRAGSGLDGIDVEYIRGRGIEVVCTGGSNSRSVAEHVVSLVLAVAKSIVGWDRLARDGGYARRDEDPSQELYQKRWGIVGVGNSVRRWHRSPVTGSVWRSQPSCGNRRPNLFGESSCSSTSTRCSLAATL